MWTARGSRRARSSHGPSRRERRDVVAAVARDLACRGPCACYIRACRLYIVPRGDGLFMVGATMIESDQPTRDLGALGARAAERGLCAAPGVRRGGDRRDRHRRAARRFPTTCRASVGCGDTLYVNGLFRHGFLLAPALARRVAADVLLEDALFSGGAWMKILVNGACA